ncbi:MAG: cobyrinate a,c-diamide synthase [Desulfitobacterium sp.]|nr:cobyrinate a,c-diamide synthase [Desulfitobacterium sp.]
MFQGIPRLMIAGTHSGVGKTTLATGIIAALCNQGLPIQGFKVGPDYIDPTYHHLATSRPSYNLDRWLLRERLISLFQEKSQDHYAIIEGVMGLFDGVSGAKGFGSSGDIAKLLKVPVVLIVNAANMSRSIAALVHGYATFDPDIFISGVILNRVKSSAQEELFRDALEEIQVPIIGALPVEENIRLPERHLGLIPTHERALREEYWQELNRIITDYIDLQRIRQIMEESCRNSENYSEDRVEGITVDELMPGQELVKDLAEGLIKEKPYPTLRLGLAWDEAFSFYYPDAIEALQKEGFTIIPFSPLKDDALPKDLDALFIGGGFLELHLETLSSNHRFLESLREFSRSGKSIYAECGGYLYLGDSFTDLAGNTYPMAGIIPLESEITKKLHGMGYREGVFLQDNFLSPAGSRVFGHEFHYSKATLKVEECSAFELQKGGKPLRRDGYACDNVVGSFLHLNFAGHPELVKHWVKTIKEQ